MKHLFSFATLLVLIASIYVIPTSAQPIPFTEKNWSIDAKISKVETYKGKECLFIQGGAAFLPNSDFLNGSIEFDICLPNKRGFMGVVWRAQDATNYEEFYIRPHQSGNPDANQYTPVFNGLSGWQLYHGEGYGKPFTYTFDNWIHVKLLISGQKGEVYIDDMQTPVLLINDMKRSPKSGNVGLTSSNLVPVRFANFQYKNENSTSLKSSIPAPKAAEKNTIMTYSISTPFAEDMLLTSHTLAGSDIQIKKQKWKKVETESYGILNIAKFTKIADGNTVFIKLNIQSDTDQIKKWTVGYSDRIRVYNDGKLLYGGNNGFRTRDYRYLGTIGFFDDVFLELKKGNNEVFVAVSESFGGWGLLSKFEDMNGIQLID